MHFEKFVQLNCLQEVINYLDKDTRRKIVEVILLNFRSNLGHKDKLEVI